MNGQWKKRKEKPNKREDMDISPVYTVVARGFATVVAATASSQDGEHPTILVVYVMRMGSAIIVTEQARYGELKTHQSYIEHA